MTRQARSMNAILRNGTNLISRSLAGYRKHATNLCKTGRSRATGLSSAATKRRSQARRGSTGSTPSAATPPDRMAVWEFVETYKSFINAEQDYEQHEDSQLEMRLFYHKRWPR